MKSKVIIFLIILISLLAITTVWFLKVKISENVLVDTNKIPAKVINIKVLTYHDDMFNVTYSYPKDWFGPEIYNYENGFRFEIGTAKVYPYGTDRAERQYTTGNNYFIVAQFDKKPIDGDGYALTQYNTLKDLKEGESIETMRNLTTKVRNININGLVGVEYISTLSDTAQTEMFYIREAILVNSNQDTINIRGSADGVIIKDVNNWKSYYEDIDKNNLKVFTDFVNSVSF
jgi:hypothetical protein